MAGETQSISSGRRQFLVAPRRALGRLAALGVEPLSAGSFQGVVSTMQRLGAEIVSVKARRTTLAPMGAGPAIAEGAYVVRMDDEVALAMQSSKPPNLIIEEDAFLGYSGSPPGVGLPTFKAQSALRPGNGVAAQDIRIQVVGDGGPLANAHVILEGSAFPVEGRTDESGMVVLRMVTIGSAGARSLFVDTEKDYW